MKQMTLKTSLLLFCLTATSGLIEARDTRPLVPERSVQYIDPDSTVLMNENHQNAPQEDVDDQEAPEDEEIVDVANPELPNPINFPIHNAAATGNLELLEELITVVQLTEQQIDFTALDDHNLTPMHYAACFGQSEVIRRIYQLNPHLIAMRAGEFQAGPLLYAVVNHRIDAINTLLALGADPHERIIDINIPECEPIYSMLRYAVSDAPEQVVEAFLNAGYQFRNDDDIVHGAADHLNIELVRYLIEHHAPINQRDVAFGFLPIHSVAMPPQATVDSMEADEQFARKILLIQLLKSTIFAQTNDGKTVLHLAAWQGDVRLAEYLIQQSESMSPLSEGHANPVLINMVDNDGNTAFHAAAANNQVDMIGFLVNENNVNVNQQNQFGRTALHKAVARGHREAITALIRLGALLDVRDIEGNTPLNVAMSFDQEHNIDLHSEDSLTSLVLHEYGLRHPDRAMAMSMFLGAYNYMQNLGGVIAFYMLCVQHHGFGSKQ